jgi:hypothetical protein
MICPSLIYMSPLQRYGEGMGIVRIIDRRSESRAEADLLVTVWGIDTKGERFLQQARAREISLSGALLSGLDAELRSGDLVGVLYTGKKARFRVVWVRHSGNSHKVQAAIHRLEADLCPWMDILSEESNITATTAMTEAQ